MTPEEVIKSIEEIRAELNDMMYRISTKLETLRKDIGQVSTCVWDKPQSDRINADPPRYEEIEIFQYCVAHGTSHRRAIAWLGDRGPDDTIQLLVPGTRQLFATMRREPVWSLEQRALNVWESVFNPTEGA